MLMYNMQGVVLYVHVYMYNVFYVCGAYLGTLAL